MSRPGFKRVEPFSPRQISNCCVWLDASDTTTISLSGSNVTQWRDKSGSNNHATGVNNPTYSNGTMNFVHASQTCFTLPNGALPSGNASCGYFVVFTNSDASVSGAAVIGGGQPDGTWDGYEMFSKYSSVTQKMYWGLWSSAIDYVYTPINANTIFSTQYNNNGGGANGIGTMVVNGTIVGTGTGWGPLTRTNNNNYVGSMYRGTAYAHSGTISEVIVYSNALTTTQQQQVEGYLAQKWQFKNSLPGGHLGQTGIIYPTIRRNGTLNTASTMLPYYTQFSPLSISGCKIWLDATDSSTFTLNGSTVSAWNDKTGNGYNVTQATTSNQPTRGTNEVIFNGTNHILQYTGSIGISGNPYTAYVIYKATVIDVYLRGAVTCMDSTSGFSFEIGQFDRWTPSSASTYLQFSSSSNITLMGINSEPAGSVRQSLNGQAFSAGGAGWSAPASGSALAVGYSLAKGWYFGGSIYEFLLFSRTLTDTEHNQITGYLASKWGSQTYLPSNHPNKTVSVGTLPLVTNLIGVPRRNIIPTITFSATGGTIITSGSYTYHLFTSSASFTVSIGTKIINYLVVGGGGGGGDRHGGGGGAGGVLSGTWTATSGTYTVTVGAGGDHGATTEGGQTQYGSPSGAGSKGGNSSISSVATAYGGGGGGTYDGNPSDTPLGSGGGGGGTSLAGIAGTAGQGNSGGSGSNPAGGGGGGASAAGGNANSGTGGNGTSAYSTHLLAVGYGTTFATSWVLGNATYYIAAPSTFLQSPVVGGVAYIAAGGGGASYTPGVTQAGGYGGGGRGDWDDENGLSGGTTNTGSGGGATRSYTNAATVGRNGGSGLVLVWYLS